MAVYVNFDPWELVPEELRRRIKELGEKVRKGTATSEEEIEWSKLLDEAEELIEKELGGWTFPPKLRFFTLFNLT